MTAISGDLRRYRENYLKEQDGIALYRALARAEKDSARADIFEKLAAAEERHAVRWARLMESGDAEVPKYKPGWRILLLAWLSRNVGAQHVLPVVSGLESRDQGEYTGQAEATGLPAAERAHSRTLRVMEQRGGASSILKSERWHRTSYGGSLRAVVFGANDGLISNFSLVMGVTGANAEPRFVLLAGVAGLLAGAFSMAAGEYVSVRSQREFYEQQLALEAQELAAQILSNPETALDTLAREELGLDPSALGSPWVAASSAFLAFATGALIPVVPYLLASGRTAFVASSLVCGVSLFIVGALISIFTGRNMLFSGLRMLGIGALAAAITYFTGHALGVGVLAT